MMLDEDLEDDISRLEAVCTERDDTTRHDHKRLLLFGADENLDGIPFDQKSLQPAVMELIVVLHRMPSHSSFGCRRVLLC
jgi:hypothetical protein